MREASTHQRTPAISPTLPPAILEWLGDTGPKRSPGREHGPDPEETLERVSPIAPLLGVTRVADITGLDEIGIPVATAYRPNSRSLAVSQGKGVTPAASRVSALMEALEAAHAERPRLALRMAREAELAEADQRVARPGDLPQRASGRYHDHVPLLWAEGRDLGTGETVWVPYEAVHLDLTLPDGPGRGWYRPTSNGLASGNTMAEAVCHAMCELIERDAVSRWERSDAESQAATRLDPTSIDDPAVRGLLDRYAAAGIEVALYDLTGDLGVPVVLGHIADGERNPFRPLAPAGGAGCHLHSATAVTRALTEAAQTRLIDVAGARDDLFRSEYHRRLDPDGTAAHGLPPLPVGARTIAAMGDLAGASVAVDVATVVHRVTGAGLSAIAVDLTDPDLGIPVVRVVVPGLDGPPASMAGEASLVRRDRTTGRKIEPAPDGGRNDSRPNPRRRSRPVVFAGPSIPATEISARLDAEVRPPAAQGDVARAAAGAPAAIVLIDGSYEAVPAVWHKEILWALTRGVPVYGAASMGALRASELDGFGMVGVGAVYADVVAGRVTADDEVAVAHAGAEAGFIPVSLALVDVRATLDAAVSDGVLRPGEATMVTAATAALFYPQRVWPRIVAEARVRGLASATAEALATWVGTHTVQRKRLDAEEVLDRVREDLATGGEPVESARDRGWRLEATEQWRRAEAGLGLGWTAGNGADGNASEDVPGEDLLDELRLEDRYFPVHQACLVATLGSLLSVNRGGDPDPATGDTTTEAVRLGLGLDEGESLSRWLAANEIDEEGLSRLAVHQADLVRANEWGHDEAVRRVPDHLRLRGQFEDVVAKARAKRRYLADAGLERGALADLGLTEAELWRWFFTRGDPEGAVPEDLDAHAAHLGFEDKGAFRRAVLRAYCYENRRAPATGEAETAGGG